jgi:hypothetical protein
VKNQEFKVEKERENRLKQKKRRRKTEREEENITQVLSQDSSKFMR